MAGLNGVDRRVFDPDKKGSVRVLDDPGAAARRLVASRITAFTGEHEFLSTLSKSCVVLPGEGVVEGDKFVAYPTVEHTLQAAKSTDPVYRQAILACKDPVEAKRRGAKAPGWDKEGWKTKSLVIMEALLRDKFRRHKGLRAQLIGTGTKHLIYENEHNDQFWGTCKGGGGKGGSGGGQNHLGQLLEKVRADEKEGLLAILLWAKQIFLALPDAKVHVEMTVTREGAPLPEADLTLNRKAIITFGKLAENDVPVAHPSTSRFHSLIVVSEPYGPLLIDLEAANGTFLDDRRLEPFKGALLTPTSIVALGTSTRRYSFTFDASADAKRSLAMYEVLEDPLKLAAERPELGVFVNNLPKDVTEEMVLEFFSECGTVLSVSLPRHKTTKEPRGFAIVLFGTEAAVFAAMKLDRDDMGGTEVRVKRRKKEEGGSSGGGGGGGGRGKKREEKEKKKKVEHYCPSSSSSSGGGGGGNELKTTAAAAVAAAVAAGAAGAADAPAKHKHNGEEKAAGREREGGGEREGRREEGERSRRPRSRSPSSGRRGRRREREEEEGGRQGGERRERREHARRRHSSRSRSRERGRERGREGGRHESPRPERERDDRSRDRERDRGCERDRGGGGGGGGGRRRGSRSRSRERGRRSDRRSPPPSRRWAERRSRSP